MTTVNFFLTTLALVVTLAMLLTSLAPGASAEPNNLLPNASFELGLGQGLPTNWADLLNPLTIKLAATEQHPATAPAIEEAEDTVEGRLVARVSLDPGEGGFLGHLTSPAVAIEPGRAYVLSAYARSNVPSAKLHLSVWTRPLDWREQPDAQSAPLPLTEQWQRYEFCFTVAMHATIAVADLAVSADAGGEVWFDAIQLEPGPQATAFVTRCPVEVSLSAKDKPFNGGLQLAGEPVTIDVDLYNSMTEAHNARLELRLRDLDDELVAAVPLADPVPPGYTERKVSVELSLVGDFIASCHDPSGARADVAEYRFALHPVMAEDRQGVLVSVDGKVRELPAERVELPWRNSRDWYAEPAHRLVVGQDDNIYVFACDGAILQTADGGRIWDSYEVGRGFRGVPAAPGEVASEQVRGPMYSISVLRDGAFVNVAYDREENRLLVNRSEDAGNTWEIIGEIPEVTGFQPGAILELDDGTLVFPGAWPADAAPHAVHVYRSVDRGKTWSAYPLAPGGEPYVDQLKTGHLLAVVRHNVGAPPGLWDLYIKNEKYWRPWIRAAGNPKLTSYKKNLILLDSYDGGMTWQNARDATYGLDEMHGMALELPDGRIVLFYVHRMPYLHGGERAKVSRDGGYTWDKELYHLNTTPGYPGYSANCVLPPHLADGKPGMILSIVAQRAFAGHPTKMFAVRWRPLD